MIEKVRTGDYVVVWNRAEMIDFPEIERFVLVYDKAAEDHGGIVCFSDRPVQHVSAGELRATLRGKLPHPPRIWTDVTGRFSTEASLVGTKDGTVFLRKANGSRWCWLND